MRRIQSLLVANRSEIAIRVMRAAAELGIRTVSIYSNEDRFALHRFKADESYLVGEGKKPLQAYLDIADVIRIAKLAKVDAIHPGYGFLSENPDFARACAEAGIAFIGPTPEVMTTLGNKVAARNAAVAANVPVMPATGPLPRDLAQVKALAAEVGYPLMLKASWGGGGRGMRVIETEADLDAQLEVARREAGAAFGNDEVYLEKLVRRARHVEVQILGDTHGNVVHLFERDCSVQRRNQKVVERAPAPYLDDAQRAELCEAALRLARAVGYTHAGTVEFLMDADTGRFYFIEVNPRIQVEHTVTEQVTGIDIVKAQIRVTEGARIGAADCPVPQQPDIRLNGHALQCRITTEDPENGFTPDYGRITAYRSAAGFGLRLDGGTAYSGAVITPFYDSLLVKVTAWAPTAAEAIRRMDRGLREFRIRGVATNLQFVENVINHADFLAGTVTTRFIDNTPELFRF
ncbi:MAG TPA: biotin carboxylase N-terminal domain-containing protein, partial [Quisquiliibacterium sp.]|nr:biotin carboxylase N-terminal domain-containing protein [Quisquiliibacterium sp.]